MDEKTIKIIKEKIFSGKSGYIEKSIETNFYNNPVSIYENNFDDFIKLDTESFFKKYFELSDCDFRSYLSFKEWSGLKTEYLFRCSAETKKGERCKMEVDHIQLCCDILDNPTLIKKYNSCNLYLCRIHKKGAF